LPVRSCQLDLASSILPNSIVMRIMPRNHGKVKLRLSMPGVEPVWPRGQIGAAGLTRKTSFHSVIKTLA